MSEATETQAQAIADLVVQLGRITHGSSYSGGLTPAQWSALRYLSRANRFSRTVSAFAEFHATTRGTASQTVKALVAQGYLSRKRSRQDGRSARLELTDNARAVLSSDPSTALVSAADALPPSTRGRLVTGLERLLGHVVQEEGKRPFGVCRSCSHLEIPTCWREGETQPACAFFAEPLEATELELICVNFQPREKSAMRRAYDRKSPA
jgi:DNA-binding MarR family transcriptional regulator